jgi:hypothetical protein
MSLLKIALENIIYASIIAQPNFPQEWEILKPVAHPCDYNHSPHTDQAPLAKAAQGGWQKSRQDTPMQVTSS